MIKHKKVMNVCLVVVMLLLLVASTGCTTTDAVYSNVQFLDENGVPYGVKQIDNKPRVSSMPYLFDIAEGNVPNHEVLRLDGLNEDVDAAWETLWEVGGMYVPPAVPQQMEVRSSNVADAGVVIKSGTSDSITEVITNGAHIYTLTDAGVDFTAATAVAAGDCLLLDGDSVPAIVETVAANVITAIGYYTEFATSTQDYRIVDDSAGGTGIKVVRLHCLDNTYATCDGFVVMNGTTNVDTISINILRVNNIHAVFTGTSSTAVGNVDIRNRTDHTTVYRRIIIGANTDRCSFWTVPLGYTGYIAGWVVAEAFSTVNRYAQARLTATSSHHSHYQPDLWAAKDIIMVQDNTVIIPFQLPVQVPQRTDIQITVSCPDTNGIAVGHIEGWYEKN